MNNTLPDRQVNEMISRWNEAEAAGYIARYGTAWSEDLALRTYLATLIGAEDSLVLHGGGNCSVKTSVTGILGQKNRAIFVKASGCSMASMEPRCYAALDLGYLLKLRTAGRALRRGDGERDDDPSARPPFACAFIEALVHAFIPAKFIDHTHPDAILALTNQADGRRLVAEALGNEGPGPRLCQARLPARAGSSKGARGGTRQPGHGLDAARSDLPGAKQPGSRTRPQSSS